jgi:hypothetical protein
MELHGDAVLSNDRTYRYRLTRAWGEGQRATFIMLNPSIADEKMNDRTLGRCIGFAKRWGLGGLNVVNLYALRATNPADLWRAADPVGPENDRYLRDAGATGEPLIAAWGAYAKQDRVRDVLAFPGFNKLTCLATTKRGYPRHPLYLDGALTPISWPT